MNRAGVWGIARIGRSAGIIGSLVLVLLWARVALPPWSERFVTKHGLSRLSKEIVWPGIPESEIRIGQTQFVVFAALLAVVFAAVLAYSVADHLLERYVRFARGAAVWIVRAAVALDAYRLARRASPFLGTLTLASFFAIGVLLAPYAGRGRPRPARPSNLALPMAIAAESLSLGWGLWLTLWAKLGLTVAFALIAIALVGGARIGWQYARDDRDERLRRDALVGAPLLLLPLVGILRAPSVLWVAFATAACFAMSLWISWRPEGGQRSRAALLAMLPGVAPAALGAALIVPLRFRELPTVSLQSHESMHLGWINSILYGKLMMADAGTVYGPLREYYLAAFAAITGVTLEHVREAHILANLAGMALLLAAAWRVTRERPWLQVWALFLAVVGTQLEFFLTYRESISFGWADLTRQGMACLALVGAVGAVGGSLEIPRDPIATARSESRVRRAWDALRARPLVSWGILTGFSILYSQDFGLCAFGSLGLAAWADALFRTERLSPLARLRRAYVASMQFTIGTCAPLLVFVAIYAAAGKATLLGRTLLWTGMLAAGVWSGNEYPVGASTLLTPQGILAHTHEGWAIFEFILPPAACVLATVVVAVTIARRTWTHRSTMIVALLLFSVTSFRHALLRCEIYHLRSCGTGPLLLVLAMATDVAQVRLYAAPLRRLIRLPLGALAVGLVALAWASLGDSSTLLRGKLERLARGEDAPSVGPKYANPDVPRAGDVFVPENVRALVRYVDENSTTHDAVLATVDFIQGGEYAFLTKRRNPTRFDVPHELLTREHQREVLSALKNDPPKFIIGTYFGLFDDETKAYIAAHWEHVSFPGGTVLRYEPPPPP